MTEFLELTDEDIDEYLSVALSNASRVGPDARKKLKGLLKFYAKKKHPFTACVRDNTDRFGKDRAERVCAVLKDIIRGTTKWRGKNNPNDKGVSRAAMSEEELVAEFALDLSESTQNYLDELDEDYVNTIIEVQEEIDASASEEANLSDDDQQILAEMYFDDSDTKEEDGLIYKTVLREGEWAYSPGPGGIPIDKPIKVVKEGRSDARTRTISIEEIKSNFAGGAKEHVTVPTSHEDRVHENTGFVKDLRIGTDEEGRAILEAGIKFTEPEIEEKVKRGTIANTSAGILFDYIQKESGKKFNAIMAHTALTNSPWLNGMKPFGVEASENLQVVAFSEANSDENPANNEGGRQVPEETTTSQEETPTFLSELGLSEDEVKARLAEYDTLRRKDRENEIKSRIKTWEDEKKSPAVLTVAESILMADEGAVTLNLSEGGKTVGLTASEIVERLVAASPAINLDENQGSTERQSADGRPPQDSTEENEFADLSLAERTEAAAIAMSEKISGVEAAKRVLAKRAQS